MKQWRFCLFAVVLCILQVHASVGKKRPERENDNSSSGSNLLPPKCTNIGDIRTDTIGYVTARTCSEFAENLTHNLSILFSSKSTRTVKHFIFYKCESNIPIVANALAFSVRLDRHVDLFREMFHRNTIAVQRALVHLIEISCDPAEFYLILKALSCDLKTSILRKGILLWVAIYDKVDMMKYFIDKINHNQTLPSEHESFSLARPTDSKLQSLSNCIGTYYRGEYSINAPFRNAFSYGDDACLTPLHHVQSVEMARVFRAVSQDWYFISNKNGVTPFSFLLRSGNVELAESITLLECRYIQWQDDFAEVIGSPNDQPILINASRGKIIESFTRLTAFNATDHVPPFSIEFKGEPVIDAGGPRNEFFSLGMNELFIGTDDAPPYFKLIDENSHIYEPIKQKAGPEVFFSIGRFIAIAFYFGIPCGVEFIPIIYQELYDADFSYSAEKLFAHQDPVYYNSINELSKCEDIASLSIYFNDKNGTEMLLTKDNFYEFRHLTMMRKLYGDCKAEINYFVEGFKSVLGNSLVEFFTPREIAKLLKGNTLVTPEEFLSSIEYKSSGSTRTIEVFAHFRKAISELTNEQVTKLVLFTTGRSKLPFGGLLYLSKPITVVCNGKDETALPSASTCFHFLHLPDYTSAEQVRGKLLLAIEEGMEFHKQERRFSPEQEEIERVDRIAVDYTDDVPTEIDTQDFETEGDMSQVDNDGNSYLNENRRSQSQDF